MALNQVGVADAGNEGTRCDYTELLFDNVNNFLQVQIKTLNLV